MPHWRLSCAHLLFALALTIPVLPSPPAPGADVAFPDDVGVLNVQRDFGAKGDGVTDDTEALQQGLDASHGIGGRQTRVLFLPRGVYRVTDSLIVKNRVGPWVYGADRDGVVIRLDDNTSGVTAVLRTHPTESGENSADWFMRNIRNLTIHAGANPETDGIRWFGNNSSILKNVRVVGNGKIGINGGFRGQNGPNLIQDVVVEGFETGILASWTWGQTLSRVTIRDCREVGVVVDANSVAIEDLTVENTPCAIRCELPNDWNHWSGVLALIGGRFSGGDAEQAAIQNRGVLYARDVETSGFKMALESDTEGGNVAGPNIETYVSHPVKSLFDSPAASLGLPIKSEPVVPWETDPDKWLCAHDFGVTAGDNSDDTEAIQKALDAAAEAGKTTVYFRGAQGGDPNWINLNGEVHVHGSVRHIIALGFGRILGSDGDNGRFVVDDRSAPVVKFEHLHAFGGRRVTLENRSTSNTLVVESSDARILGTGQGDIFVTDCPSWVELRSAGQKLWARQLNPEGDDDMGLVRNAGGHLWVLGAKFEGVGTRFRVSDQGRTEVYGVFLYDNKAIADDDLRPIFDIDNAHFSVAGLREISFAGPTFNTKVREKRGEEVRLLTNEQEQGWIGWSLFAGWPGGEGE